MGFRVVPVIDGVEAYEYYQAHPERITLVLLDMTMPNMGGEEALKKIRGLDAKARVILCSGYTEERRANLYLEDGLTGFIQKPYRWNVLRDAIRNVLKEEVRHA